MTSDSDTYVAAVRQEPSGLDPIFGEIYVAPDTNQNKSEIDQINFDIAKLQAELDSINPVKEESSVANISLCPVKVEVEDSSASTSLNPGIQESSAEKSLDKSKENTQISPQKQDKEIIYKCCRRTFDRKSYDQHMLFHQQRFRCEFCEENFKSLPSFKNHVYVAHTKRYCPYCSESYWKILELKEHIQVCHPDYYIPGYKKKKSKKHRNVIKATSHRRWQHTICSGMPLPKPQYKTESLEPSVNIKLESVNIKTEPMDSNIKNEPISGVEKTQYLNIEPFITNVKQEFFYY